MVYEVTRSRLEVTQNELRARDVERERAEKLLAETRLGVAGVAAAPALPVQHLNAISALIRGSGEGGEASSSNSPRCSVLARRGRRVTRCRWPRRSRSCARTSASRRPGSATACATRSSCRPSWNVPGAAARAAHAGSEQRQSTSRPRAASRRRFRVRAEARDGRLRLGVWDAGAPFALEAAPPGHGLDGLQARLTVLYGEEGRLAVESADGGKAVSLSFPLRSDS